jgi:hypothetical protein
MKYKCSWMYPDTQRVVLTLPKAKTLTAAKRYASHACADSSITLHVHSALPTSSQWFAVARRSEGKWKNL